MLLPDTRDGSLYAALNHGHFGNKFHRSDDGGATWAQVATPAYPPRPEGRPAGVNAMGSPEPAWTLSLVWSLEAAGPDRPGAPLVRHRPGGPVPLRRPRRSHGARPPALGRPGPLQWFGGGMDVPGIHSVCVDPRDSRHVAVGVSCGGVWATRDGGDTWACRADGMRAEYMPPPLQNSPNAQDPHRVVQSPSDPDVFWAQHHNGIFRTTDGAASWHEITAAALSAFGFAVAVHPRDPDTAWFAPGTSDQHRIPVDGKVVVSRTRDGGRTFDVLRDGLPQRHAYDLTLRHALDVDDTGDVLAFGSTTGSLWVSEDAGDHWSCVSTHLPPVYCVRFPK